MATKNKNPCKQLIYKGFRGVGENRTLVQTSNQRAFYAFILRLSFRQKARPKAATSCLAL